MYASDVKHPIPSLEDKLHRLYTLNRDKKIDLSFRPPYLELLKAFGNPHLNLPPVIHVAGTNGKGSTIAFMRSILEEAGYKVHAYTSPHLCTFNERIYLVGQLINNAELEKLVDEALALGGDKDLTFFEITTAMAFAAFSRTPADILLLEVGLGGRLDCTNVIEKPLASVITSIGYDHTEHLGETLNEIAAEKAGIMKEKAPCIIGAQNKDAVDAGIVRVFESKAESLSAPLLCYDADWFIEKQGDLICFSFEGENSLLPLPHLLGPHQIQNAGAALMALQSVRQKFPIKLTAMQNGIQKAKWAGRMQALETARYNMPEGWEIWLDGGHNQNAAEALAAQTKEWGGKDQKPLHLVIGMMAHKDPAGFLAPLIPFLDSVTAVNIVNEPAALSAEKLSSILNAAYPHSIILQADNAREALQDLCGKNQKPGRILITGSLYLAGHILKD